MGNPSMPFPHIHPLRRAPACALLLALLLSTPVQAQPTGKAALRFRCEGDSVGAAITINGQFRGECPFDVAVTEGRQQLRSVQQIGQEYERVFEQEVHVRLQPAHGPVAARSQDTDHHDVLA